MSTVSVSTLGARNWPSLVLISAIGALLLITTILIFLVAKISDPSVLPINKVDISGNLQHLEKSSIEKIVSSSLGERGFFRIDVVEIQTMLTKQPWVHRVVVRRVWKDTLSIRIVEQIPVAKWGEESFLNKDGQIFTPDDPKITLELVQLNGPKGLENVMLEHYTIMVNKLSTIPIGVAEVILTDRGAWRLITTDGKELIFGKQFLAQRLDRFLHGYSSGLSTRWNSVKRVDLRYSNGFAIASDTFL